MRDTFSIWLFVCALFVGLSTAAPARANYMAACTSLIEDWKACGNDISACAATEILLMTHCKCHQLNEAGTDWEFVAAVTAIDDVCGTVPTIILKKPPPPGGGGGQPGGDPPRDGTPGVNVEVKREEPPIGLPPLPPMPAPATGDGKTGASKGGGASAGSGATASEAMVPATASEASGDAAGAESSLSGGSGTGN